MICMTIGKSMIKHTKRSKMILKSLNQSWKESKLVISAFTS